MQALQRLSLGVGLSLWAGATAMLLEDALHAGHLSAVHLVPPLLTAGTAAAGVLLHHSIQARRLGQALAFLGLAGP